MAVRLTINGHVKPGTFDKYAEAWSQHYDEVNAKDGCVQYELFHSTRNPDHTLLLEHWATREAFESHWAVEKDFTPRPTDPFRGEPGGRASGRGGLEIYYDLQYYSWDGKIWKPADY